MPPAPLADTRATIGSSNGSITHSYNDGDMVTQDSHTGSGTTLENSNETFGYNDYLQLTSLGANTATTVSQSFTYDTAGRLASATDGAYNAAYSYVADSRLVSQIVFKNNTTTRLTTTKTWDNMNRLLETRSQPAATGELPSVYGYAYNNANQRINTRLADGSYWVYQYDKLGQVVSGKKFWPDGAPVAGQQFEYAFDTIGNRTSAKAGGDENGKNLQSSTYTPNALNQYDQRTVPGAAPALGLADAGATVTVNSQSTYRRGEYFWKEIPVSNSGASVWQSMSVQAVNGASSTTVSGNEYVAKTPEVFSYDLDGNLTQDGRWTYMWDAENRLVTMVSATANGPQQKLSFKYDPLGRRIRKTVWNNTAGSGSPATDLAFLYEGWNLVAELNAASASAVVRTYLWGTDLSGSRQGAGGVGGLLAIKSSSGAAHFATFDGNGNVMRLVDGSSGATSASYEYGPFGETLRQSGSFAASNPIRFSTKFQDSESTLIYYGHRYYSPSSGRFLGRDPLTVDPEAMAILPDYLLALNDPLSRVDILGLVDFQQNSCEGCDGGNAVSNTCRDNPAGSWHDGATGTFNTSCTSKALLGAVCDTETHIKIRARGKCGCTTVRIDCKFSYNGTVAAGTSGRLFVKYHQLPFPWVKVLVPTTANTLTVSRTFTDAGSWVYNLPTTSWTDIAEMKGESIAYSARGMPSSINEQGKITCTYQCIK